MDTEGTQTAGRRRFLQNNTSTAEAHWPRQRRRHHEAPYGCHAGPGTQPPSSGRDVPAGGPSEWTGDGEERSGRRGPRGGTGFVGSGPYHRILVYPWEMNPGRWNYPLEPGTVGGPCVCVTGTRPFTAGIPHPLPHLQVKGQGPGLRRTVSYVCVDHQGGRAAEDYRWDPHGPPPGGLVPNGHCGPRPGFSVGGWDTENHRDRDGTPGGSEEARNGHAAHPNGFSPAEVPLDRPNQKRWHGAPGPPHGGQELQIQDPDATKRLTRQDSVRDQIRQVVTDLEDVLGGLKQVHSEMKEVVEQIDRLTAGIHLGHEARRAARAPSDDVHGSGLSGDSPSASPANHRSAPSEAPRHADEGRVVLQTNSPSPVHMASVVKTRGFTPPSLTRDVGQEKTGANGHPPHLHALRDSAHVGLTGSEPRPHSVDPKVVIRSGTDRPRTHRPPPYPQNGQCGRGLLSPAKPECSGRGRQNGSVV